MMGDILMSSKELQRVRVMERVIGGALTLIEASVYLGLSYRHSKRLKATYRKSGPLGLIHGNRGRQPANSLEQCVKDQIENLSQGKYADSNDSHFTEMLSEREGITISRETIRKVRRSIGQKAKRKRRPSKHRSRRPRKPCQGMLVQWDGSPHRWFGDSHPPCCLLIAVDDADGKLLAAIFVPSETSEGYLRLLNKLLIRHGIPMAIYHDRHTIFVRTDESWTIEEQMMGRQYPTHVGRVLEELNICSVQAYSPQAKGRVERSFGTLQDRLIAELALEGISDMKEANKWLDRVFIRRYNRRFAKKPESSTSAFRKISKPDIYHVVSYAYEAVVGNDNCVRLGGLVIDIPKPKRRMSFAKKKVLVRHHLDGKWTVWGDDNKIASHNSTPFKEPVRSWKIRKPNERRYGKHALQVYIASKPAAPSRGHIPFAIRGSY
jgi:transposase